MRRDVPEPGDAAVLHRGGGVEALGNGVGDDRETLLLEQLQQAAVLGDQRIDPRSFAVQEGGDKPLLLNSWQWNEEISHLSSGDGIVSASNRLSGEVLAHRMEYIPKIISGDVA
jgi:hypothetical protein